MSANIMPQQNVIANARLNRAVLDEENVLDADQQIVDQALQNVHTEPKAQFNEHMHMHHDHHHTHKSLGARLKRLPFRPKSRKAGSPNAISHGDEHGLHTAAADFVDRLHKEDEAGLDQALDEQYDELSQYFLLDEAKKQIKKKGLDPEKEKRFNQTIDRITARLERDPRVLAGKQESEMLCSAIDTMQASSTERTGRESVALRQLRGTLGSSSKGRYDEPLSPLSLAKSMQRIENVDDVLSELSAKFASGIRSGARSDSAPLWLSFKDLNSIATVRTSFNLAGKVRRDLSEKANVSPKQGQMATAVALLTLAEAGGCKAEQLLNQMAGGQETMTPRQCAGTCAVMGSAIADMPIAWWRQDKIPQRLDLLTELRQLASDAHMTLPMRSKPEENLERRLRTTLHQVGVLS